MFDKATRCIQRHNVIIVLIKIIPDVSEILILSNSKDTYVLFCWRGRADRNPLLINAELIQILIASLYCFLNSLWTELFLKQC